MSHRCTGITALLLSACTMGLEFAHVLEWGPKRSYPGALYTRLQESLYFWFGTIGAGVYILAVIATIALAVQLRHGPVRRRLVRVAAALEVLALGSFLTIIYPANQQFPVHGGGIVPAGWQQLRLRWEAGHALGFVLFLAAFLLLLIALLRERVEPGIQLVARLRR